MRSGAYVSREYSLRGVHSDTCVYYQSVWAFDTDVTPAVYLTAQYQVNHVDILNSLLLLLLLCDDGPIFTYTYKYILLYQKFNLIQSHMWAFKIYYHI